MESLIKAKFSRRFIESGRVLSTLNMKKQRVLGRIENVAYISLYNPLEDKWALVRNANASYPCYSLDIEGNPIAIYLDMMGNIRERQIKQQMFLDILENSEGSQEFRELVRAAQNVLKHNYTISFVKPSLGYDLPGLPSSCQKGKGNYFEWCDDIAKMAILRDSRDNIVARCLIWDRANITHNGKPVKNDIADRLYYHEGIHKIALKNELKKLGIESIWKDDTDERPFEYGEYTLSLSEEIQEELDNAITYKRCPFLDTFNHYDESEGVLYSFHWRNRLGWDYYEWGEVTKVLLETDGTVCSEDNQIWDDYSDRYIDRDDAVEPANFDGITHIDNCCYSEYHNAHLLDDGDIICVRTPGGYDDYDYTYHGSGVELIEINDEVYFLDTIRRYRA